MTLRSITGLVLAVALALGCDMPETAPGPAPGATEAALEPETPEIGALPPSEDDPVAADEGPRLMRTLTPDGEVFEAEYGSKGQLPTSFPDDLPLYAGAEPMASVATPGQGMVVNLQTGDDAEQVIAFYREAMLAEGWEIEHDTGVRGHFTLATRKGNRTASVVVSSANGVTRVMLAQKQER